MPIFLRIGKGENAHAIGMKKIRLYCASALVSLLSIFGKVNVLSLGTLKEISTPYIGYYSCETLRIGNRDFTDESKATLELSTDGTATLRYKNMFGKEQSVEIPYTFDMEKNIITATVPDGRSEKVVQAKYEKGEIILTENLSGKAFFAKFTKK